MTTITMTTRADICQALRCVRHRAKPFPPASHSHPPTTVADGYCYPCFTDEKVWGTETGSNFPKVTVLVRTEPANHPTAPLPCVLLRNPWHAQGTLSCPLKRLRALSEPTRAAHSRLLLTKEGSFEPDLNCPYSSSFCCQGRKDIWERNVSSAYLPHTQTQRQRLLMLEHSQVDRTPNGNPRSHHDSPDLTGRGWFMNFQPGIFF